jgi:hypothetical protein
MKADIGAGRILAAKSMSPIHDDVGSHHKAWAVSIMSAHRVQNMV